MNYLKKALFLLLLCPLACKKPTEDLKIVVDNNIIKYTALIHVTDALNPSAALKNGTLTITGDNAGDLYEISGKKQFNIVNGVITIGPGPNAMPKDTSETYDVQVNVPGYNSLSKKITFTNGQMQQVVNVALTKVGNNSTGTQPGKPLPVNDQVTLNFTGTCAKRSDLVIRLSMYVFYRESDSGAAFQYLGYMDKGVITTTALETGKKYDFQVTYDGKAYNTSQLLAGTNESLSIAMGSEICNNF
ncbi:hypothetical protein AAFN85_11235 [Mucilaginibacter sp. CAU 1740]|uniref:hypothetical protein n=1 Tax=Mucilaginibacter sp. CAU 1740 TaxID=3140365 RepID=UPI00325B9C69